MDGFLEKYSLSLAIGGPCLIVALTIALKVLRGLIQRNQATQAPVEHAEAPPKPLTYGEQYEEQVRSWNQHVERMEREISKARQEAYSRAVELNQLILLTIFDPYGVKDGDPLTKIEPLPADDPRRYTMHIGSKEGEMPEVAVDDQRSLPHDQFGYKFMPRPQREAWAAKCRSRREASKAGSIKSTVFSAGVDDKGFRQEVHLTSEDQVVQDKINGFKAYRSKLGQKADAAFDEALAEIRSDAEKTAREILLKSPTRQASIEQEAKDRGLPVKDVEEEFVKLCISTAVDNAMKQYSEPWDRNKTFALTEQNLARLFEH